MERCVPFGALKQNTTPLLRIRPVKPGRLLRMAAVDDENGKATRGDQGAKLWQKQLAESFGNAVQFHRKRLDLSAVQLSARTRERGFPITRGTISKIESNVRNSKMDVAEVLVLAAALEVAPIDLVFPGYPSTGTFPMPKFPTSAAEAHAWFLGSRDYQPFGRAHAPRADTSMELRQTVERALEGVSRAEESLGLDRLGIPSPGRLSKEQAQAILTDLSIVKFDIERLGGTYAGPAWEHHLKELVEDSATEWGA